MMTQKQSSAKARNGAVVLALGVSLWAGSAAWAVPMVLDAQQDTAQVSSFTLNFGPGAPLSSANIAETSFNLEIDPALGTARLLNYIQKVDPLMLPDGQGGVVSTGNLTISVLDSQVGSFSRRTGVFTTQELYQIDFEGDLSAFGITSPFYLPGSSTGKVTFDDVASGATELNWVGSGSLLGGLIPFDYVCTVQGVFVSTNASPFVAVTEPEAGAIDARIPHAADDTAAVFGWDAVRVTFNSPLAGLSAADFSAETLGVSGSDVEVVGVTDVNGRSFDITLSGPIAPGAWTVLTHEASGTTACLGFLPGDVDGSGTATARDVTALIDALNGTPGLDRPAYATDMNRSGASNAGDITTLIDVLNGAGAFERWHRVSIGGSPCPD